MNGTEKIYIPKKRVFSKGEQTLLWAQLESIIQARAQELVHESIRKVALLFDDARGFSVAILACAHAGVDVYLLPNNIPSKLQWVEENCQLILTDHVSVKSSLAVRQWALADQVIAEQEVVDQVIAEQAVVDQVIAEQEVVDQVIAEQAVVDQVIAVQEVVDQVIAEQAVVDQVIAEQAVANQVVVQQAMRSATCPLVEPQFSTLDTVPAQHAEAMLELCVHNIAIYLQTSGSSGEPEVLRKTWLQMRTEIEAISAVLPKSLLATKPLVLASVRAQHMYGLTFQIFLSLYLGFPVHRDRFQYPETLLSASQASDPCIWISSPTLLQAFSPEHQWDLARGKVALVISSGGSLSAKAKQLVSSHLACPVLEIYGSTETGVVAFRLDSKYWSFFPSVSCQEDVLLGLGLASAWSPDRQFLADGIALHGEQFELLGRLDRIIKLADHRVSLLQMEQQLVQHAWIWDVYVTQHPQSQRLVACIALNEEGVAAWRQQGRKQVIAHIRTFLSTWQEQFAIPRHWRFSTALPKNSQGKLFAQDVHKLILEPIVNPAIVSQTREEEHAYAVSLRVPLDLRYFKGHFERFHLVPGVVELKWFLSMLKEIGWLTETPKQIENLKFQHFLRPNDVFEVFFKRDPIRHKITFEARTKTKKIASGRMIISAREEGV